MILNLISVLVIVVFLIYLFTILHDSIEYYVKDMIKKTLQENKEHEEKFSKLQAQMSLRRKQQEKEDEDKMYSLIETYMKKNKLDCPEEPNRSEE